MHILIARGPGDITIGTYEDFGTKVAMKDIIACLGDGSFAIVRGALKVAPNIDVQYTRHTNRSLNLRMLRSVRCITKQCILIDQLQ